jgi:hypothetical protein
MATILPFVRRTRNARQTNTQALREAQIVIFTGVRYEKHEQIDDDVPPKVRAGASKRRKTKVN